MAGVTEGGDANEIVRDQDAASLALGDWFEYTIGAPTMDLDVAPYGGARFPVETQVDGRIFAALEYRLKRASRIACIRIKKMRSRVSATTTMESCAHQRLSVKQRLAHG